MPPRRLDDPLIPIRQRGASTEHPPPPPSYYIRFIQAQQATASGLQPRERLAP